MNIIFHKEISFGQSPTLLILIIASASADASGDKSAAKFSEMSAILGFFRYIWPTFPSRRLESDF